MLRPLTKANVEKHLGALGLEAEFATHAHIRGLSGGQKVKVVLAACTWNQPHILVMDEPTNYLDRCAACWVCFCMCADGSRRGDCRPGRQAAGPQQQQQRRQQLATPWREPAQQQQSLDRQAAGEQQQHGYAAPPRD
jgi:hypothetical protein